uniref:EGF-like domain-containing protein n=1 Tax=Glossina pallidipes TaxID=7398 RepID=A0A1B0GGN4_GLOPL
MYVLKYSTSLENEKYATLIFASASFAGELCNFEYNECESNPCQNAGECIDHIGNYECRCTKGYTGKRCQIKVDFCASKPCPSGHECIDHGNEYSCECPGGRNGPDCNELQRTMCNFTKIKASLNTIKYISKDLPAVSTKTEIVIAMGADFNAKISPPHVLETAKSGII